MAKKNKKENKRFAGKRGGGGGHQPKPKPKRDWKVKAQEAWQKVKKAAKTVYPHLTIKNIVLSVLVVGAAMFAHWYVTSDYMPRLGTIRPFTTKTIVEHWDWTEEEYKEVHSNKHYSNELAKTGDIVYFYGTWRQVWNELYDLGIGWFMYDLTHIMMRRPMHSGIVVEYEGKNYLLHACGSKVWFQGLESHMRYRLYMGYDMQVQPLERKNPNWDKEEKYKKRIGNFLRKYVDKKYRHPLNVNMLPYVPEYDSARGKQMRTEPWLFPFGQHPNHTMSYEYWEKEYGVDDVSNGGYTCAEIVVMFYDCIGLFKRETGFAPVTYLPYNLLPDSPTFQMKKKAKFTQTYRMELRDPKYLWKPKSWSWWAHRYYENTIEFFGFEIPERGIYDTYTI